MTYVVLVSGVYVVTPKPKRIPVRRDLLPVRNVDTTLERKVVVGAGAPYRLLLLNKNTNLVSARLFRPVECQVGCFC